VKLNETHQILLCDDDDDVNLLRENARHQRKQNCHLMILLAATEVHVHVSLPECKTKP